MKLSKVNFTYKNNNVNSKLYLIKNKIETQEKKNKYWKPFNSCLIKHW
jgi:hypothetical protein